MDNSKGIWSSSCAKFRDTNSIKRQTGPFPGVFSSILKPQSDIISISYHNSQTPGASKYMITSAPLQYDGMIHQAEEPKEQQTFLDLFGPHNLQPPRFVTKCQCCQCGNFMWSSSVLVAKMILPPMPNEIKHYINHMNTPVGGRRDALNSLWIKWTRLHQVGIVRDGTQHAQSNRKICHLPIALMGTTFMSISLG